MCDGIIVVVWSVEDGVLIIVVGVMLILISGIIYFGFIDFYNYVKYNLILFWDYGIDGWDNRY